MSMFCHQCQETARNKGCDKQQGVCGKSETVANLQDILIYTMKGIGFYGHELAKKGYYDEKGAFFVVKGLFATITNANFDEKDFIRWIKEGQEIKNRFKAECDKRGMKFATIPPEAAWSPKNDDEIKAAAASGRGGWMAIENEDVRSLRAIILYGLKGMSAYAEHAYALGFHKKEVFEFILEGLATIIDDTKSAGDLTAFVLKTGAEGVAVMALLDEANTTTYGHPVITEVKTGVRNNPGILISGHDLRDLHDLLEQTKGTGVDVYTHSEMLPAHYYPFFRKYDNLVGNYGGSWWHQKEEFEKFNGPVLLTSNCLVPPKDGVKGRIFTTGVVGFDGMTHIADREPGKMKDFSKLIALAKTCKSPEQLEDGKIVGGFARTQVLAVADKVVAAVKSGAIKRFVVMAGCDGRHKERDYYRKVAEALPKDAVILTAGCAKYQYNKLPLGDIGGIPRVLDAGQCNDSYSLAVIALKLKEVFGLDDINKLPISFDIAWYEQKAVLVLLALLHLGVKGIRLGPTLPGFLSPAVAKVLVENFDIKPIGTVEADVTAMMAGK
ncbi:MAG TPA: hydroxylamine reductase [bacterium]|nr:hydroxylamine reductase [bacterium]